MHTSWAVLYTVLWLDSYGYLDVLSAAKAEFLYECMSVSVPLALVLS